MKRDKRKIDTNDIALPDGYKIEVFLEDLTTPIDMEFASDKSLYIADAGVAAGNGKILRANGGKIETVAQGFNPPLTGITLHNNKIYASHRGSITAVRMDGTKVNIIEGLPSLGDHHNNKVEFGPDGRMYFGQGTATNSGVVGLDNSGWVKKHPYFHDFPAQAITLSGENFPTKNILAYAPGEIVYTGPYSPFGTPSYRGEAIRGVAASSGSVLSANEDGSDLRTVAWGLRNPFRMKFDRLSRLFSTNHGMDVRGSRPVDNSPDELHIITAGAWYGWPDYTGGFPVTLAQFKPENEKQPEFILARHPMIPPKPLSAFAPHSAIMGFDFNYGTLFPGYGDIYIAEFGSEAPETTGGKPAPYVGHRVSMVELSTGQIYTFAINKSGVAASENNGGGFERPIDAKFGPDGSLYIADFGLGNEEEGFIPETGVIWKISKNNV